MGNFLKSLIAIIALVSAYAGHANMELVKDGRTDAEIVMPEKPLSSVKLAVDDLQTYVEKISGAKLPIVTQPTAGVKIQVYVGESDYTKKLGLTVDDLKVEGFKIIVKDNYIALIGRDEQRQPFPYRQWNDPRSLEEWQKFAGGKYNVPIFSQAFNKKLGIDYLDATATLYAVSEFLEQLGVRWYNPYENGTVVPERKTISVPEQSLKKEPKFPYREFLYYGAMRDDAEGVLWFKRLKYGASYVYYCNHSTISIIDPPEQKTLHPEYYAMSDGKMIPGISNNGVPRLLDPGFRRTSLNFLDKVFEAYPLAKAYSLGMPDGFTQIDERDAEVFPPKPGYSGKFSDYVWDYWLYAAAELKKSHPDKYLACTAYTTYMEPPSQIDKLPENVTLGINYDTGMQFPAGRKQVEKIRSQWLSMLTSKKMYIEDFFLYYRTSSSPRYPVFFTKALQEDMQNLQGFCEGKVVEIAPTRAGKNKEILACIGLTHMLHYWQGKLYWDPDMDRKKMLDEYYELYFGPARKEMKEFYEFAEDVWMRPESRSITIVSGFLKEKDVHQYFEILSRARDKAGRDSVYDKRIAQIETEMEPLKKLFMNLKRTGPNFRCGTAKAPVIDGDLQKPCWTGEAWYTMGDLITGEISEKNRTVVTFRMTPDRSALIIGAVCYENKMDKIVAKAKYNDDFDIFNDDVLDIYIETPERSFFKIVVNTNGAIWDESRDVTIVNRDTLPTLWNPGIKVAVKKEKDRWTAEIMIPTNDFGSLGPSQAYPWGINVGRTRMAGGEPEDFAISPTGVGLTGTLSKLGNIWPQ